MSYEISVNLRARQPEGRFFMPLEEALELFNGGLAEAITLAVDKAEESLESDKTMLAYHQARQRNAQANIKRAREAIKKTIK